MVSDDDELLDGNERVFSGGVDSSGVISSIAGGQIQTPQLVHKVRFGEVKGHRHNILSSWVGGISDELLFTQGADNLVKLLHGLSPNIHHGGTTIKNYNHCWSSGCHFSEMVESKREGGMRKEQKDPKKKR